MKRSLLLSTLVPALLAGCGTDVAGPSGALFSCVFGETTAMEPGQVAQVRGAASQEICVTPGAVDGAFAYIPFFGTANGGAETIQVEVLGGAFATASSAAPAAQSTTVLPEAGAASASVRAAPPRDHAFHDWLREREVRELTPLLRGVPGAPSALVAAGGDVAADVPAVGDLLDFNVAISCTQTNVRTARVSHVSDRAIIVQDTSNPVMIDGADLEYFGATFDTLVHPVETAHFGTHGDIDDNDRAILFFTRTVNARNAHDAESVIIGFFWSGDLFPEQDTPHLQACPAANQAEMFYLIAPDPEGITGPEVTVDQLRTWAIPLIGHEYQHLINASRRMFVNQADTFEEPWLNEGLSHTAEELLFYAASGLEPGMNLTASDLRAEPLRRETFNVYMGGNYGNLRRYLTRPDTASLMGIDNLSTRGATWSFLRYAADRSGRGDEAFFFDLVNSTVAGLDNLRAVIQPDGPLQWMQDWTVSIYADDHVPGLQDRFRQPSWDLRDLYENRDPDKPEPYPLSVLGLGFDGPVEVELRPGGAAFLEFRVGAGDRGLVHVEADGRRPPETLRGSVVRVR